MFSNASRGLLLPALLLFAPLPLLAETPESWRCEIDLHQGDSGTLELVRTGAGIEGRTVVHRGENTFRHEIEGKWVGQEIRFQRRLSATSVQPFSGMAAEIDGRVRMGGRFAAGLHGVWSADCSPAGSRPARVAPDTMRVPVAPAPAPTRAVSTPKPRSSTPTRAGSTPKPRSSTSTRAGSTPPAGRSTPAPAVCSISGQAKGDPQLIRLFQAGLYGPDDQRQRRDSTRADGSGRYGFTKLPDGKYWIRWDSKADVARGPQPDERSVTCRGGKITGVDFDFR